MRQGLARLDPADTQAPRSSVLEDVRSRQKQTLAQLRQLLAHPDSLTAGLPGAAALCAKCR